MMVRSFSIVSQSYSICTGGRSKRIVNSAAAAAVQPEIAVAAAAEDAAGDAAENAAEDAASAVYLVAAAY